MKQTGWRKPTPELCVSEHYAQAGEQMSVPKIQALIAVKRVSAKIGLRGADMVLLDLLCALSQPQDWEEGSRPIVWPSNQFLAEQLGLSQRAIQRHTRKLGELGLISFKDNSNGHRRGKRDQQGRIVEAYGFDLSPLQARAGEFESLYKEITTERQFIKAMRKRMTVARRSIRGMVQIAVETGLQENFEGEWSSWDARLDRLIEHIPPQSASSSTVAEVTQAFITLHEEAKAAYEAALNVQDNTKTVIEALKDHPEAKNIAFLQGEENQKDYANISTHLTSTSEENDSHILVTNYNKTKNSNSRKHTNIIFPKERALEKKKELKFGLEPYHEQAHGFKTNCDDTKLNPTTITRSCPEFTNYAKAMGLLNANINQLTWVELTRAANQVRPSIGISDIEWNNSKTSIGEHSATIAIALIFEKYQAQQIVSPCGYLRALTARAHQGELHLTKSIYGRLNN